MTVDSIHGESEVFAANERFYEALSASDIDVMEEVWSHSGEVRCIHPGWDILIGWQSIYDSWNAIFSSSPGLRVKAHSVEIMVVGEVAWVHCLEEIRPGVDPEGTVAEGGDDHSYARSTNLYRNTAEGWKMVLHHASPVPGDPTESDSGAVH
jgi:ketosteroid isomerase-like protein